MRVLHCFFKQFLSVHNCASVYSLALYRQVFLVLVVIYTAPIVTLHLCECNRSQMFLLRMIKNQFQSSSKFFFLHLWLNAVFATHMFLWKPRINKLVTLCSHGHFRFELHLISSVFYSIEPKIFRGNLLSERVKELISVNFQVSECCCEFLYRQAVHTGFSLGFPRRRG